MRLEITPFGLQFLKYLAIFLMIGDHTSKYLFNGTIQPLFHAGRLALPLFVFILSYNLSRENISKAAFKRTFIRLIIFGCIAEIPFFMLGDLYWSFYPLNVMFTLAALTLTLWQLRNRHYFVAIICFLFGGAVGEYWWPALALGIGIFWYKKTPNFIAIFVIFLSLYSLGFINHNNYAFLCLPLVILLIVLKPLNGIYPPRLKWFFYVFYPLHLFIFLLIRIPMRAAGYLFF